MPEPLSLNTVRHVAHLARLKMDDDQLEDCRSQLATVLEHVARLNDLDLEDVEPLAHPTQLFNHLDEDVVGPSLSVEQILDLAPVTEAPYIAVPKVIDNESA